jgi:hypothetical protein
MRTLWAAAIAVIGCGSEELTAKQEFESFEARIENDCGTYERNYPEDGPLHLCGTEPDIGCINDAIDAATVTRLRYTYLDPATGELREHNYYGANGKVVWIGYYEHAFREADWHRADCSAVVTEPDIAGGASCWKLLAADCVER